MSEFESAPLFVHSLGTHHFAHLRAIAEGVPVSTSAFQYLGIHHGNQAVTAHRETVEAVRALALRHGEKAWRLVGLAIPLGAESKNPTLEEFAETTSWASDFSEQELLEAYLERYPTGKKPTRRLRLRESLMSTLERMEKLSVEPPKPQDAIAGWFDEDTSSRLATLGAKTLAQLNTLIASSTSWHTPAKAIGAVKAERIEQHLAALIPLQCRPAQQLNVNFPGGPLVSPAKLEASAPSPFEIQGIADVDSKPSAPESWQIVANKTVEGHITAIATGTYIPHSDCDLRAANDGEAIFEWVASRATSPATKRTYLREAARFVIWLSRERNLKSLNDLKALDCKAYMQFLERIPTTYISDPKLRPKVVDAGWAPFRGQLDASSQKQAIVIVAAMYTWLAAAGYLNRNPWAVVNKRVANSKSAKGATSKAFSEDLMDAIEKYVDKAPQNLDAARFKFILRFVEAVGMRSSELIEARLKELVRRDGALFLIVKGKGGKLRNLFLPPQAIQSLEAYLFARGLPSIAQVSGEIPLISGLKDNEKPISYSALYATVKKWLNCAIASVDLDQRELDHLKNASTHWLRHTFGTRAIARDVPPEVIQSQMGHESIDTTMNTYAKASEKRVVEQITKAF